MKSGVSPAADNDGTWSDLMVAAQGGDRVAYERLLKECVPMIKLVVRRAGVNPGSVDDVAQEVLITVHRARQTYDPSRSFVAWLSVIAQRRAIDTMRRQGRYNKRETFSPVAFDTFPDPDPSPEERWEDESRGKIMTAAVASLPPGQREAVEQIAIKQLSLAEAAASTGKTTGALKVNLHRALKSLAARFRGGA